MQQEVIVIFFALQTCFLARISAVPFYNFLTVF